MENALKTKLTDSGHRPPSRLYADDVILQPNSLCELQQGLLICSQFSAAYGMTWSLSKGESQVLLNEARAKRFKSLPFAGGEIETVTKAKYLGVIISSGSTLKEILKRIEAAHTTMTSLLRGKMLFPGIDAAFATMLLRSLSHSNIDYTCFLFPCAGAGQNAFDASLRRFFGCALGIRARTSQLTRLIAMFNLDSSGARRRMLANNIKRRLRGFHGGDEKKTVAAVACKKIHY